MLAMYLSHCLPCFDLISAPTFQSICKHIGLCWTLQEFFEETCFVQEFFKRLVLALKWNMTLKIELQAMQTCKAKKKVLPSSGISEFLEIKLIGKYL